MSTPRYFAPRSEDAPTEVPLVEHASIVSVLGSLRLGTTHGARAEWLIARMLSGALVPVPIEERGLLPPRLQQVLASHEVAGGKTLELDAQSIHLFELELLEQTPDAPGLDDPVELYGTLTGPFPPRPDAPSVGRAGQLTVTRSDLLAGLARGVASAFLLPPADGTVRRARSVAALLPGDRDAAVQAGEGLVLAFPLLPAEMAMSDASNEMIASQWIHDVLAMLRDDARASAPTHPLAQLALPVPSRAALESRLESDGWSVQGDVATKKKVDQSGLAGVLNTMLHPIAAERRALPPEASLDGFVALAEKVLPVVPGWPSARAQALARRMSIVPTSALRGSIGSAIPAAPAPPAPAPAPASRAPRPRVSTDRDEWMKDFVGQGPATPSAPRRTPAATSKHKPRLSPTTKTAEPREIPDWMRDFDVDDHEEK